MLRKAIENYLDSVQRERDLDAPLIALLAAMGFFDIHFLHGPVELGKDLIAKKTRDGQVEQFAFQVKSGNIGAGSWRTIQQQLLTASYNKLGNPGFDETLPRILVLITNGRLVGTAGIEAQEFRRMAIDRLGLSDFLSWDRESLTDHFVRYGPEYVPTARPSDFVAYGEFLSRYGEAIGGALSERMIEQYSESWAKIDEIAPKGAIIAVIEGALLASACKSRGLYSTALQCILSVLRALLVEANSRPEIHSYQAELIHATIRELSTASSDLVTAYFHASGGGSLLSATEGVGQFVSYPAHCMRLIEALSIQYILAAPGHRASIALKLEHIVSTEPGAVHPLSDWYVVSVVLTCIVLAHSGRTEHAKSYCERVARWVISRYDDDRLGLADVDQDEAAEVRQLLGEPFAAVEVERENNSLLITALIDVACFLQHRELYEAIIHDAWATDISPRYYQPQDTIGLFFVGGRDVIRFPNVEFSREMPPFDEFRHGEHLVGEAENYSIESLAGAKVLPLLSALLRDRYFPTTWARWIPD